MMEKKIKVTALGISYDIGLLAETKFNSDLDYKTFILLLKLIPSVILWFLTIIYFKLRYLGKTNIVREKVRINTKKFFKFLGSKNNYYESEDGFLNRISKLFNCELEFINESRIGLSLHSVIKSLDSLPKNQDIFFIHLGDMDLLYKTSYDEIRNKIHTLLHYIGANNPAVHVVILTPSNHINSLVLPSNSLKVIKIPFSPTADFLISKQGFRTKFPLTCESSPDKIKEALDYYKKCEKIFEEELNDAIKTNLLSSGVILDNFNIKGLYDEKNRHKFFALDSVHLSAEGHQKVVEAHWGTLKNSLVMLDCWYNKRKCQKYHSFRQIKPGIKINSTRLAQAKKSQQ